MADPLILLRLVNQAITYLGFRARMSFQSAKHAFRKCISRIDGAAISTPYHLMVLGLSMIDVAVPLGFRQTGTVLFRTADIISTF